MKKTLLLLLILVVTASAEKVLWRDEMNCTPMIPKEDYSEIWIPNTCSDPVKAFSQWIRDNHPNWKQSDYEAATLEKWTLFYRPFYH